MRRFKLLFTALAFSSAISAGAAAADCGSERTLRSEPGGSATDISFHNGSASQRRIYWIDGSGQRKLKAVVEPGKTERQATVASHHWIVTDSGENCLYAVTASSAPMMVEVGGASSASAPAQDPSVAGSATAKFGLVGWYQIKSLAKSGFGLNNLKTGYPELERTQNDWESAYWGFTDVAGTPYVTIQNKWTGKLLHDDRGSLRVSETSLASEAAHWLIEGAEGQSQGRIKNRRDGRYLVTTAGGFDLVPALDGSGNGRWQFVRTGAPVAVNAPAYVPAPAIVPRAVREPDPPVKVVGRDRCSRHETWSHRRRECVQKSASCTRHEVYSSSMAQCIPKSAMCEKNQVYSSSLAQCILKVQPKPSPKPTPVPKPNPTPKPQPKPPGCKYKTDGPGNCLTPAFLQCQKSYAACQKACGKNPGCKKGCDKTYGNTCGNE